MCACRRAHEDRKLRSAEELILAAKMSYSKNKDADTGNKEDGAQELPPSGHYSPTKNYERPSNASVRATTDSPGGKNTEQRLLVNQHGRTISSSGKRNILDNSGRFDDVMAEDECGHVSLVDVSRRPARAPRKYAEEELDRYCESHSSTTTKVGPLQFAPSSLFSIDGGDDGGYGRGARRTPRRVPVRPTASGKGVTRGGIRGDSGIRSGSASPRAVRGQLVEYQSLSAR